MAGADLASDSVLRDGAVCARRFLLIGHGEAAGPLGSGASGEVWLAHDTEFDRQVALKILREPVSNPSGVLRFELEKQVLARMEHPNIAKVYEGGKLPDGRPFLAMELLQGKAFVEHCTTNCLPLRDRLKLFIDVCRAIQHAHDRFVLHRDLKPGNILVVDQGGRSVPMVIDFGIAKILGAGEFTADQEATMHGLLKGSPAYMSPEQTRGSEDLTIRSDVYSLGVVLYEILSGDTPVSREREDRLDLVAHLQAIREEEPAPPSRRLRQIEKHEPARARLRAREVKGDLDSIALRTLQKDPEKRYGTADELADDIQRFLQDEPVLAKPPGGWYRVAKFLRRHRTLASAGIIVLCAIVATAGVSTTAYFSTKRALDREAESRRAVAASEKLAQDQRAKAVAAKEEAQAKRLEAEAERRDSENLIGYMLFELRAELERLGRSSLLSEVSDQAERYFAKRPEDGTDDSLERNRAIMYFNRGHILLAKGDAVLAIAAFSRACDVMRERRQEKDTASKMIDFAMTRYGLGLAHMQAGETEEASTIFSEVIRALRRIDRMDASARRLLAASLEGLGELKMQADQPEEALALFNEQASVVGAALNSVDAAATLPLAELSAQEHVGIALQRLGRAEEARMRFEQSTNTLKRLVGEQGGDLALRRRLSVCLQLLGNSLLDLRQIADANAAFEESLESAELLLRIDPSRWEYRREAAIIHHRLAATLILAGDFPRALRHAQADLAQTQQVIDSRPQDQALQSDLAASHYQIGVAQLRAGKPSSSTFAQAREHFEKAAEILRGKSAAGSNVSQDQKLLSDIEASLADLLRVESRQPKPLR